MISGLKDRFFQHAKNLLGWKTKKKIVVISVDDYGNVRLDSKKSRMNMDKAGLKILSRFDALDTLETREDLEMLLETLSSVQNQQGQNPVFTPYALPCNIDFERMRQDDFIHYHYEPLTQTFEKLSLFQPQAYKGAWALWQEGIEKGLLAPQFHGREHFNLKVFEEKLDYQDPETLTALKNRSYTSISSSGYPNLGYTHAFGFDQVEDAKRFPEILSSGIQAFDQVFQVKPTAFTAPAQQFPYFMEAELSKLGIRHFDKPFFRNRHLGNGKFKKELNFLGYDQHTQLTQMVRNVVFEPTEKRGVDWPEYAFKQIEAAFRLNRPAIISSHRVNFCGHIEPQNRREGIKALQELLKKVVHKWPEVEFMAAHELGDLIRSQK